MRVRLFCLSLVLLISFPTATETKTVVQQVWSKEEFPNLRDAEPHKCGRTTSGAVCDPNNVLNATDYDRIDKAAEDLRHKTKCDCVNKTRCSIVKHGYTVGIVIVRRMALPYNKPSEEELTDHARQFAQYQLEQSKLGQCEDDIVIFISDKDNRFYAVVGETTARKLSQAILQDLYMDHRKDFLDKNYADGLVSLINTYRDTLRRLERGADTGIPFWSILVIIGILLVFGVIVGCVFLRQGLKEKRRRKASRDQLADEKVAEVTEPFVPALGAGPSKVQNRSYEAKSEDGQQL